MAPGMLGGRELSRAGPGGGGPVGRGPRLLGDLGAITVSLPPPPFPRAPVGAVKMQDTRPATCSPGGGAQRGLATDSRALSPPSRAPGAGSPGRDTARAWVTLWPGPRARSAAGAVWVWQVWRVFCEGPPHTSISVSVSLTTQTCVGPSRGDGNHPASQLFPLFLLLSLGLRVTRFGFDAIVFTRLPLRIS